MSGCRDVGIAGCRDCGIAGLRDCGTNLAITKVVLYEIAPLAKDHSIAPEQSVSNTQVVPAQAGIQWSARDDWVPAYAGMTDKREADP
ncbi:MAG: hypothetical protein K9M08_19535 [Pirellula sp.]|nr:hypothetical protein [Pirellula sp.]